MTLNINDLKDKVTGKRIDDVILVAEEGSDGTNPIENMVAFVWKDPLGDTTTVVLRVWIESVTVPPGRQVVDTAKVTFLIQHGEIPQEEVTP